MQVLIVSPEYPPYSLGGGGIMVKNLAEELERQKIRMTVITGYYPVTGFFNFPFNTIENGIKIEWLPLIPTPRLGFQLKTIMPPNLLSFFKLIKLFINNDFNLVHIHGYGHFICDYASILCAVLNKKYILTVHGFPSEPTRKGGILKIFYDMYDKSFGSSLIKRSEKIVAVSKNIEQECHNYVGKDKISVIHNAINLDKFKKVNDIDKINVVNKYNLINKKVILCIGRIAINKGFQFVIEALPIIKSQISNVHLIIIGKDEGYGYLKTLKQIVNEKKLESEVSFIGGVSEQEKIKLLSISSVVTIPSIVEPFGIVAIEALASGKPIVASDVGGLSEILRNDKYSTLVKSENIQQIASSLITILKNETLLREAEKNIESRVKNFELKEMGKRYIDLYHEIAI